MSNHPKVAVVVFEDGLFLAFFPVDSDTIAGRIFAEDRALELIRRRREVGKKNEYTIVPYHQIGDVRTFV